MRPQVLREIEAPELDTLATLRTYLLCRDCARWFVVARSEAEAVTRCPFCGATG